MKLFEVFAEIKVDNKQANKALDTTELKGSKLGKGFGKLTKGGVALNAALAGIAIAAVGAITKITKASIKAFDEQEKAEKRLVTIAKTVTKATDQQIESLKELASAYQEVTTFGDDVIISGQSQLLSFGVSAQGAEQLTQSLVDLLAATKGANATQEDAINAANLLGKAYSGQAGALSRAGILLNERQKQLLETGTATQKVSALTDILNDNYGQLAQGLADTREGQMIQFRNALSDIGENFAEILMPALTGFTKFLKGGVLPALQGIVDWLAVYGPKISSIFTQTFGIAISVIKPLVPLFTKGIIPILNGFIDLVVNDFTTVATIIGGTINLIVAVLKPFINLLSEFLRGMSMIVQYVADHFGEVGKNIIESFEGVYEFLQDIDEAISNLIDKFKEFFELNDKRNKARYGVESLAPFNLSPVIERDLKPGNIIPSFEDLEARTNNTFENGAIQVTIPIEELAQVQDITDFFEKIPELRRGRA